MKTVLQFLLLPVMLLLSVFGRAATFDQNSAVLTNPYMPWNVGAEFVFIGTGDAAGISIRYRCLAVESIGGVNCLKVEVVDFGRANLRTYWWLAQDTAGNVWQLQQSDEQFDGSWETESGEGIYMPATFTLGEPLELYGLYPDVYTVVSLTGTAPTPYRTFTLCVVTELSEFSYVEQDFIAPGFGPVRVTFSGFENGSFDLQSVSGFNPPAQQVPMFTVHPNDQTITEGESAVFTISASGDPIPTYQWQRRPAGSAIWSDFANGGSYSGSTSATLTVSGTTLVMSGDQFRCIAINAAGSAPSNPATLTVLPRRPITEKEILEGSVTYGVSSDPRFPYAIIAKFTPANGMTLSEAAAALGVDHFNWLQVMLPPNHWNVALIDQNQLLPWPTTPAPLPLIDPIPHQGFRYLVTVAPGIPVFSQWRITTEVPPDDKVFYFNEDGEINNYIRDAGHSLLFKDAPKFPDSFMRPGDSAKFTTRLVGVRTDGSYRVFAYKTGFSWESDAVFDASDAVSGGIYGMFPLKNPNEEYGPAVLSGSVTNLTEVDLRIQEFNVSGNSITVRWKSSPGLFYTVQASTNLHTWDDLDEPMLSTETSFERIIQRPVGDRFFYRIKE